MITLLKINNILAILSTLFISFPHPGWSNVPLAKYINIIKVNSSFADFDVNSWERQHQVYETADLQIFMVCIWNISNPKVSLYKFNTNFNPTLPEYNLGGSNWVAYRESFNILNVNLTSPSSAAYTAAFKKIFEKISTDFPSQHYGIKYAGHGVATGGIFENKISADDTQLLLSYFNGLINRKIDFLDWNTNCNAGSFNIVSNEYKYSNYILASDILRGGYNFDVDEYFKYSHEQNLHKFFQASKTIRNSLIDLVNSEYNFWNSPITKSFMIKDKITQSISIYDSDKFDLLLNGTDLCNPNSVGDALKYIKANIPSKEPTFNEFRFHYVSNKNLFIWPSSSNGFAIVGIPAPKINTNGEPPNICEGENILLTSNYSIGNQWYKNDTAITGSIQSDLVVSNSGRYTCKTTLNGCVSSSSNEIIVSVHTKPGTPIISQQENELKSSSNQGNQWYLNNMIIPGAVNAYFSPQVSGYYAVQVTLNNCSSLVSNSYEFTVIDSTKKIPLKWINFSPYHLPEQNPNSLSVIPEDQIIYLLDSLKPYTEGIRTFGTQYGLELVPALAKQRGFKVIVGIWLSKDTKANAAQIANGIAITNAGYADRLIVGSEVLLRGDLSPAQLTEYIKQVKQACPNIPVSTADVYNKFTEHPQVMQEVDFIAANIYPFWEGITVECAMMRFHEAYLSLLPLKGGKEILISEAGWKTKGPNVGEATPSLKNAIRYDRELLSWSKAYGIPVCLFSFIDEPWKSNSVNDDDGWGIFDNTVKLKPGMDTLFTPIINIDTTWLCKNVNNIINSDALKIDYIPVIGSFDNIKGHVNFLPACGYSIAAYIKVGGVWWTKPFLSAPTVSIQCNGKWSLDYTTGGSDQLATDFCLFLIPGSYVPPSCFGCVTIAPDVTQHALSSICITRKILPSASLTASKETTCPGDTTLLTAQGGTNYIWSTGDNQASIKVTPTTSTTYSVTITDANGGGAIIAKTITVNAAPVEAISVNSLNICAGDTATLTASC